MSAYSTTKQALDSELLYKTVFHDFQYQAERFKRIHTQSTVLIINNINSLALKISDF